MRITKQWLEHTFQFYNNKYFSGKLKTPLFNLSCPPGNWGYYQPNGNFNKRTRKVTKLKGPGTIFIASDYEREKKRYYRYFITRNDSYVYQYGFKNISI